MIRRIELTNFMSHAHTVIEPAEGLTVLVGPNNCGKSAVVAALQILAHNETSTYVMRHGEKECSVTVETDEGRTIQWRRRKSPAYFLDGAELSRLERSEVPEEVSRVLRLSKISAPAGTEDFDIHFGEQKSPVFLLDKPGSQAAQFFASSSDASKLVEMQKRHQQKMSDARKERARLAADGERLARDLSILAEADPFSAGLQEAESCYTELQHSAAGISSLDDDVQRLTVATQRLTQFTTQVDALSQIGIPPALEATAPISQLLAQLAHAHLTEHHHTGTAAALVDLCPTPLLADELQFAQLFRSMATVHTAAEQLTVESQAARYLAAPPSLADVSHLSALARDIATLIRQLASTNGRAAILNPLTHPPTTASESTLTADIESLRRTSHLLVSAVHVTDRLANISAPPVPAETRDIQQAFNILGRFSSTVATLDAVATAALTDLTTAEAALRSWADTTPTCPACGNTIDPVRFAEHARTHLGRRDV